MTRIAFAPGSRAQRLVAEAPRSILTGSWSTMCAKRGFDTTTHAYPSPVSRINQPEEGT